MITSLELPLGNTLDDAGAAAIMTSAWAAKRWNLPGLKVPGFPAHPEPSGAHPRLSERRARSIAAALLDQGITSLPAPAAGPVFRLSPPASANP